MAIDGKTSRRTHDRAKDRSPFHLVSAWASSQRLVLGQQACAAKSNEITAIPLLLDRLAIRGALVTIDAMGCQTRIAQKILDRQADYLLAVNDNRSVWGWRMLAVGANPRAAELSGVRVRVVVLGSFALSGLLAAGAGLVEMSRVAAALPSLGVGWLLSSLVVPILGGTALAGGAVSVVGTLVAAVFIDSIDSGLVSLSVPAYWQQFAEAIVLLAAVMADRALRRRPLRRAAAPGPTAPAPSEGEARHAAV